MAKEEVIVEDDTVEEEEGRRPESDDPEIVELEEGQVAPAEKKEEELPEQFRGMSAKQMAQRLLDLEGEVKTKGDASTALKDGIAALGEKLQSGQQVLPIQEKGESEEEFAARFSKQLFEDGTSPFKAMDELVEKRGMKKIMQALAPMLQTLNAQALKNAERDVKTDDVDGPIFKRYEREIRAKIKSLPMDQQNNPQVFKYITDQVKIEHFSELVSEGAGTQGERPQAATATKARAASPFFTESASSPRGGERQKVYVTAEDKRIAMENGMPIEEYVKRRHLFPGAKK
jgi:hypothetical protein